MLTESRTGSGQDAFSARVGQVMRAPRAIGGGEVGHHGKPKKAWSDWRGLCRTATPETQWVGGGARLAELHSVRVREPLMHEVLPLLGRSHLADSRNASLLTAFWKNETRALNSTGIGERSGW